MAGAAAGAVAGAGPIAGIFGILKEIIDEVGDITQALIEQLNAIKLIDKKVETTSYRRYRGHLTKRQVTTDHYVVTLWEVLFLGLVLGVWKLARGADGKLGLKMAEAGVFGLAGMAITGYGPFVQRWTEIQEQSMAQNYGYLAKEGWLSEEAQRRMGGEGVSTHSEWDMPVVEEGGVGRVGRHGNPADEDD